MTRELDAKELNEEVAKARGWRPCQRVTVDGDMCHLWVQAGESRCSELPDYTDMNCAMELWHEMVKTGISISLTKHTPEGLAICSIEKHGEWLEELEDETEERAICKAYLAWKGKDND